MNPATPKRMDAYLRVSSVGRRDVESESYITEDEQRRQIEGWAEQRGIEIAAWHLDRDVSGGKSDRPGLDAAMEHVNDGATEGIVVATLDRFSRQSTVDALKRVEEIHAAGGTIASVGGEVPVDPSTGEGEFILTLFLSIARMERRRYAAKWEAAKVNATGRGVKISRTPFGYLRDGDKRLVPDGPVPPAEPEATELAGELEQDESPRGSAWIVATAFRLAASSGVHGAMSYLKHEAPDRRWTPTTVRRLLSNRTYIGEIAWGDQVTEAAHQPLTDPRTFELAQSTPNGKHAPSAAYPLTGLAACGTCGQGMAGTRMGQSRRAYKCTSHLPARGDCEAPASIMADHLEDHVRTRLVVELEARQQNGGTDPLEPMRALDVAEQQVQACEDELVVFARDTEARGLMGEDAWRAGLEARSEARDKARGHHEQAMATARAHQPLTLDALREAQGEDLARMLRGALTRVEVKRGRGGDLAERVTLELHDA